MLSMLRLFFFKNNTLPLWLIDLSFQCADTEMWSNMTNEEDNIVATLLCKIMLTGMPCRKIIVHVINTTLQSD